MRLGKQSQQCDSWKRQPAHARDLCCRPSPMPDKAGTISYPCPSHYNIIKLFPIFQCCLSKPCRPPTSFKTSIASFGRFIAAMAQARRIQALRKSRPFDPSTSTWLLRWVVEEGTFKYLGSNSQAAVESCPRLEMSLLFTNLRAAKKNVGRKLEIRSGNCYTFVKSICKPWKLRSINLFFNWQFLADTLVATTCTDTLLRWSASIDSAYASKRKYAKA